MNHNGRENITVVGQLPGTSVIQNAPNQKSIFHHRLKDILDNNLSSKFPSV